MKIPANLFVQQFIRSCTYAFTVKDSSSLISHFGVKASRKECVEFLNSNPNIFPLANGNFITRACVFTERSFSFKPTKREVEKGFFAIGHRCMPFVDPEILSCTLTFKYNGKELPHKIAELESDTALELFRLYGDEFIVQYICADPANRHINLAATDFMLPPKVNITGISLEPIIKKEGFKCGDRLFCTLEDWDEGIIRVEVQKGSETPFQMSVEDVERENWNVNFEKMLLENFDAIGPCSSIEEQLAILYAEYRYLLCVENCGSIDESLSRSKKIGFQNFGVESRLWRKGEDVPAVGNWNYKEKSNISEKITNKKNSSFPTPLASSALEAAFIKDQIFYKERDEEKIFNALYPHHYSIPANLRTQMLLHLKSRHDIIRKDYNRFADYNLGVLRRKALDLYTVVNELISAIDVTDIDLNKFPQQPLVILTQIYEHITRILELTETNSNAVINESDEIILSLEGMEYNYNDIKDLIKNILEKEKINCFGIIK